MGHQVTVYGEGGASSPQAEHRGVQLRRIAAPKLGPLATILYDSFCLWDARRGFDVVYMLGYGAAPACMLPRLWGTTVWINPDGIEWARAKWNRLAKIYFRMMEWASMRVADRVIADSRAIAASLAARHGKRSRCAVIPYGCEIVDAPPPLSALAEWGLSAGDYYLIVCRLEPENHVLEMLRAFQQSRSARKLVVVGNHRARGAYARQLCAVGDPRIRMIGTVYDAERLTALRYHAFAYMHGHSVGGTNPSLLEAMGCGNVVFAHRNPFNQETLAGTGIFFDGVDDLARAIDEAESNEHLLHTRRAAIKLRARTYYQWFDVVAGYAALLEQKAAAAQVD